jgi:hypothetical protein
MSEKGDNRVPPDVGGRGKPRDPQDDREARLASTLVRSIPNVLLEATMRSGILSRSGPAIVAIAALGATCGCNTSSELAAQARDVRATASGAETPAVPTTPAGPVLVSCEPHQRTLVRAAVVNGQAVSQVECVTAAPVSPSYPAAGDQSGQLVQYVPAASAVPVRAVPAVVTDSQPERRVVTGRRTAARSTRSWKKSAVIIGSSAGVGAGVGAAIGGKKGALIGAAIGGGSAAIWDQVTRR